MTEDVGTVTVCAVAVGVDPGETITLQYSTSNGAALGTDSVYTCAHRVLHSSIQCSHKQSVHENNCLYIFKNVLAIYTLI